MAKYRFFNSFAKSRSLSSLSLCAVSLSLSLSLSLRQQKCYVNEYLSNERTLNCGDPQGSILGPLLFLIYINDLPHCLQYSTARMYADDTNITTTGSCIREIITFATKDLVNISE